VFDNARKIAQENS